MPKGHVPEREVECRACHRPFRTTKVGRAAFFCREVDCLAARAEQQRERNRNRKRGPRKPKPRAAPAAPPVEARLAEVERREAQVAAALAVLEDADAGAYADLHREVTRHLLAGGGDRPSLGRRVRELAHAGGVVGTRVALRRLAVEALAWESRLSGSGREFVARDAA